MNLTKKIAVFLLVATILVGFSSCKTQQGCPNNFSLEISQ